MSRNLKLSAKLILGFFFLLLATAVVLAEVSPPTAKAAASSRSTRPVIPRYKDMIAAPLIMIKTVISWMLFKKGSLLAGSVIWAESTTV